MKENKITEGSKLIAEYLGWKYVPSNDLGNFPKPGWWEFFEGKLYYHKSSMTRVGMNGGTGNFICRNHHELRFYNSMDALLPAIKKLEKEDLSEYIYKWTDYEGETRYNFQAITFTLYANGGYSEVELDLDPPYEIVQSFDKDLTWTQNTFNIVVDTIKFIKELRDEKEV